MHERPTLLNSRPKTREHTDQQQTTIQYMAQQPPTHMTYNGIVQAQSVLVNDTEGTKKTITTQMSPMVIVIMEACF